MISAPLFAVMVIRWSSIQSAPVPAVTSIFGAPVVIYMMINRRRGMK